MKTFEEQYLETLQDVLTNGTDSDDRTGVGTKFKFGTQLKFNVSEDNFPIITTRKLSDFWIYEYCAFVGNYSSNISSLGKYAHIWEPWADAQGNLGNLYGYQLGKQLPELRKQLKKIILKEDGYQSYLRRLVMTMWSFEDLNNVGLTPCHGTVIQFNITGNVVNLSVYQRSADLVLGLPHNVCYYSLFLLDIINYMNFTRQTSPRYLSETFYNSSGTRMEKGYVPGTVTYTLGDYHIYKNQIEGVEEQLTRISMKPAKIRIWSTGIVYNPIQISIKDYEHHPSINFPKAAV